MMPISVLLAEDHALVRAGFRALLQDLPDVQVVAEAADGRRALQLIEQLRPDIVLMDISMPGLNGLEATARVVRDYPETRVIILSMHTAEEYVLQAFRAGAAGYLIKDADPLEFPLAVRAVARGKTYLSPAISRTAIQAYARRTQGNSAKAGESNPFQVLTPRQREVLQLVAEGRTSQEIAIILTISVKTVERHRYEIMNRLELHDLASLVRYAIQAGLVSSER
jgi:DNA-binding NarL/FixJ family response regulator